MGNQGFVLTRSTTLQDAAGANGNGVALDIKGYSAVSLQISGTFSATVNFEATIDDSNWVAIQGINLNDGSVATAITATGLYLVPTVGLSQFRTRISGYGSGNVTVEARHVTVAPGMSLADIDVAGTETVDIASITPGTGATDLGKAEDAAHNSGDVGVQMLAVRQDVAAALGADGDYVPLIVDNAGNLYVKSLHYDQLSNGTIIAAEETVELDCARLATIGLGISGTWEGTIVAEIEVGDGVWDTVPLIDQTLASATLSTTSNGNWILGVSGSLTLRIRASAWTSGSATVYLEGSAASGGVMLTRSLPTGVNNIGDVGVASIAAGSNTIGAIQDDGPATAGTPTYTTSADMTTPADIGPAPTAGEKSVLLQAAISTDTAMQFTLQMETTPGNERVSFYLPANGTVIFIPRHPIKLGTADKAWQGKASAAGNLAIHLVTTSEA